jgi:hypothetical protein
LNNPEPPDIVTTQTFCEETRPTIASIQNTSSNTIVYYDEDVVSVRYSFALLYDNFEENYLVSMFQTKRGAETAYGISYQDIQKNLHVIKTVSDIEKLAVTKIPFVDDTLFMFRNFVDGSKDIKTAFNYLKIPLLELYNHIQSNSGKVCKNNSTGDKVLFGIGKFHLTYKSKCVHVNPSYFEIDLGFLKKLINPYRSATSSKPLLKIYNKKCFCWDVQCIR